jgi:hypothetical protein
MRTYEITFNERSKVGKYLLAFLEENKKYVKLNDPTEMTEAEFDAKLQRAREQYARGEYTVFNSEDFKKKYGLD